MADYSVSTIDELSTLLSSLETNTVETAYSIELDSFSSDMLSSVNTKIKNAKKYVAISFNNYQSTVIGSSAFSNCESLTSIEIPSSVTSIGDGAFQYCHALSSIEIPSSVTSIGNYAFQYCTALTSIEIPSSVTSIGDRAFLFCSALTSIEIPDTIASIGNYAFSSCKSLSSIEIPSSVTSIGDGAFQECIALTSIEIPSSVTSLGSEVFRICTKLASVTIPDSITSIGDRLFSNCESLTSIEIPSSVTSIGSEVFESCTKLASVTIPDSITSIGDRAFQKCSALTSIEIPSSVTSLGSEVFDSCTKLASVTIPDSITSIGDRAFQSCIALTSIEIPSSVTNIEDWLFNNCKSLTSIEIPDTIASIGNYAFSSCESLSSIEIPSSVTSIGNYAFQNCPTLGPVLIHDITDLGNDVFKKCHSSTIYTDGSLETVVKILQAIKTAGNHGVYRCSKVCIEAPEGFSVKASREITLPYDKKQECLFWNYINGDSAQLDTVTSENPLKINVTNVTGEFSSAFSTDEITHYDCGQEPTDTESLESDVITEAKTFYCDYSSTSLGDTVTSINCTGDTYLIKAPKCSSQNLTNVDNAYKDCSSLTDASGAFRDCANLDSADSVFEGCTSLTDISSIFEGCTSLSSADDSFSGDKALVEAIDVFKNFTALASANRAFKNCTSLNSASETFANCESLVQADSVFEGCTNLEGVSRVFKGCKSLVSVDSVFKGCSKLDDHSTEIFSDCTSLSDISHAFEGCTAFVVVRDGIFKNCAPVTAIETFKGSSMNTVVTENMNKIKTATGMYENCSNLQAATLKGYDSLQKADRMFKGCGLSWSKVDGSASLLTDTSSMFMDCTDLSSLTLPDMKAVTDASSMFEGCTNITSIHNWTIDTSAADMTDCFKGCTKLAKIYIKKPDTSKSQTWSLLKITKTNNDIEVKVYESQLNNGELSIRRSFTRTLADDGVLRLYGYIEEFAGWNEIPDETLKTMLTYRYPFGNNGLDPSKKNFVLWADSEDNIVTNLSLGSVIHDIKNILRVHDGDTSRSFMTVNAQNITDPVTGTPARTLRVDGDVELTGLLISGGNTVFISQNTEVLPQTDMRYIITSTSTLSLKYKINSVSCKNGTVVDIHALSKATINYDPSLEASESNVFDMEKDTRVQFIFYNGWHLLGVYGAVWN